MKCIQFTGGMDSTLVAYEQLTTTDDDYVFLFANDKCWAPGYAEACQQYLIDTLFKDYRDRIEMRVIEAECSINWHVWFHSIAEVISKWNITELYSGTTQVYEEARPIEFKNAQRADFRGESFGGCELHQPIYDLHRHEVVQRYVDHGIIDHIIDTQSCKYLSTISHVCTKCDQCIDRYIGMRKALLGTEHEWIVEADIYKRPRFPELVDPNFEFIDW